MDVYSDDFFKLVSGLDRASKTAFAAACAERLWPLLERYAHAVEMPELVVNDLRDGLDAVWRNAFGSAEEVSSVQELAEMLYPTEDDEWVFESGYGENSLAAIAYAASTWLTDDTQETVWGARQLHEAADYAAQAQYFPDLSEYSQAIKEKLQNADVVRAAVSAISEDLETLLRGDLLGVRQQSRDGAVPLSKFFV